MKNLVKDGLSTLLEIGKYIHIAPSNAVDTKTTQSVRSSDERGGWWRMELAMMETHCFSSYDFQRDPLYTLLLWIQVGYIVC